MYLKKRKLLLIITLCLLSFYSSAVPSYMWYSTYSIENYVANGNSQSPYYWKNLGTCHEDANGFSLAVQGHSISNKRYVYNRMDTACTAARWTGVSAEVNYNDFVFYAGHGWGKGPFLGYNSGYPITSWTDIRFGGNGYLKWVQAAACEWFVSGSMSAGFNMSEFDRWTSCFQGVHTVMGHRAFTYDHSYSNQMSDAFWDRWRDNGQTIYSAWRNAQIDWVYTAAGMPGLQPAVMAASGMMNETWANATNSPASNGASQLVWATVGSPQY